MKRAACVVAAFAYLVSMSVLAHEGGHGPKLPDAGKQGGVVSEVVAAKDASKGHHAQVLHKSELLRSEDGTVRVYLYDSGMNALDLSKFEGAARGVLSFKKNKKRNSARFELKKEDGAFVGVAPRAGSKPFDLEVTIKEDGKELLTSFHNLD